MTRWERSNAPAAQFRHREIHALLHAGPGVQPDEHANGLMMGSAPVTKRTSSPVEAVPTYRAPSRPTPRGSTRDPGPVDTRGLAGGSRKPGSRSRLHSRCWSGSVCARRRIRKKARHSDARSYAHADARCPALGSQRRKRIVRGGAPTIPRAADRGRSWHRVRREQRETTCAHDSATPSRRDR